MITLQSIEARIADLRGQAQARSAEIENLKAVLLAIDGALQDCEHWKAEFSKDEAAQPAEEPLELTPEELATAPQFPVPANYEPSIAEKRELEASNGRGSEDPGEGNSGVQHQHPKANGHDRGARADNHNRPQRSYSSRLGRYS